MTDEELIARLRKADEYEPLGHDGWEAADRIEALVKERDEYKRLAAVGELAAQECRIWQGQAEAAAVRVEWLESALRAIAGASNSTSAEAMRAFAKSELKGTGCD